MKLRRFLGLPFFTLKLLWVATPSVLGLIALSLAGSSLFWIGGFWLAIILLCLVAFRTQLTRVLFLILPASTQPEVPIVSRPSSGHDLKLELTQHLQAQQLHFAETTLSNSSARTLLPIWKKMAQLQPTHRDILINLTLIYLELNQPEQAKKTWQQAQESDPNHPALNWQFPTN